MIRKGRILSVRGNRYDKTHPLQHYFATKVGNPEAIYLHAEIATMIASTHKYIHGLMVIRMDAHGNLANAKPCNICKEAFKHFNINEVKYSDSNGRIKYL